MKTIIVFLSLLFFSQTNLADSFTNMNEVSMASELLESSPDVTKEIETQINSGFDYLGFIAYPNTSYCNCKKFVLIFKMSDYDFPANEKGQHDHIIVKKLVEVSNLNSDVKIFTMTDKLGL